MPWQGGCLWEPEATLVLVVGKGGPVTNRVCVKDHAGPESDDRMRF